MLILYVHAHMHVGTRVWLAPTCEWVWYTLEGKGREGEKSEERRTRSENGRSLFQRTLRSSTARSPSKQDTQWQRWQRWQWWQWWVWRTWSPLSLSLSSPPLISPRGGWYNGQVALVDSCSLFPWLFVAFGLDHRKSSSIVRFFRKLAVPVSLGSKGDYTWRRFFFERERYDRSRNISTASGAEFWDEYRSGFGWRRRN